MDYLLNGYSHCGGVGAGAECGGHIQKKLERNKKYKKY